MSYQKGSCSIFSLMEESSYKRLFYVLALIFLASMASAYPASDQGTLKKRSLRIRKGDEVSACNFQPLEDFMLARRLGKYRHFLQHFTPITMCTTKGGNKRKNYPSTASAKTLTSPGIQENNSPLQTLNHVYPKFLATNYRLKSFLAAVGLN